MDAVQASYLRTFANAMAWALQAQPDPAATQAGHLNSMLGTLEKSVQASAFLEGSTPVAAAPRPTQQTTPRDVSKPAAPGVKNDVLAARFFNRAPWGASAVSISHVSHVSDVSRVQDTAPQTPVPSALTDTKAADFFASLSWGKSGRGEDAHLSIGAASDDPQRAKALVARLGQSARPGMLANALPQASGSAAGFFAKIPWRGQASAV